MPIDAISAYIDSIEGETSEEGVDDTIAATQFLRTLEARIVAYLETPNLALHVLTTPFALSIQELAILADFIGWAGDVDLEDYAE